MPDFCSSAATVTPGVRTYVRARSEATILHADLDAFYASVEQRDDPRLRGRPVIVGEGRRAGGQLRGQGVRRAHGDGRGPGPPPLPARRRGRARACRPTPRRARRCSRCSSDTTPLVEGLSIDEAFLDVGGLRRVSGTPTEIAVRLRSDVLERVGLPITVGVARTKFLAKVASGVAKPDGLLVVPPDGELAFLHPLPVERLWGVGPVTAAKLHDHGITTVGEVARLAEAALVVDARAGRRAAISTPWPTTAIPGRCRWAGGAARSGRSGRSAARRGRPRRSTPSSSAWSTGSRAGCGRPSAVGRTVVLRLRFDDFSRATRSHTLARADGADRDDPRRGARRCSPRPRR